MDLAENVEIKPAVNQLKTNVFSQQWDSEKEMEQYGTKIMAWAPIAQADADLFENPTLQAIAESHGRTVAQVALRYLIQRGIIAIPKTTHIDRMKENLDIFDFELSAAEMDSIRPLDRPREFQGSHRDPELVRFLLDYDKKFIRPTNNPARKRNTKGTDGVFVVRPFSFSSRKGPPTETMQTIPAGIYRFRYKCLPLPMEKAIGTRQRHGPEAPSGYPSPPPARPPEHTPEFPEEQGKARTPVPGTPRPARFSVGNITVYVTKSTLHL